MPELPFEFDVFLSHNSKDKPIVEKIAEILRDEYRLKPWLDKWERIPGTPWQEMLEEGLNKSATVAVFLSEAGYGRWENEEMRVAVDTAVSDGAVRVIPVLLPGAPEKPELPRFLRRYTWVDLRQIEHLSKDALSELFGGITNTSLGDREAVASQSQASAPSADTFRQLRAENVQPARIASGEIPLQRGINTPTRREVQEPAARTPTPAELRVSRKQLQDLHEAQHTLQHFLESYIKFSELRAECERAKSEFWEQLENQTDDLSGLRYWNDMKELLMRAQAQAGGKELEFVKKFEKSENQFNQFMQALDGAMQLLETVQPKAAKSRKLDVIKNAHARLQAASTMAESIIKICQDGAKDQLKEISVVIDNIFDAEPPPASEASAPPQESHRPVYHPVQAPGNSVPSTTQQQEALPSR